MQLRDGNQCSEPAIAPLARVRDMGSRNGTFVNGRCIEKSVGKETCFEMDLQDGDFGFEKAFDVAGLSGLTCSGTLASTPHFMPRQQAIDFRFAKPEVDVWAAACLYYMLTCQTPRRFIKDQDMFTTLLETDALPIRTHLSDLSPRLAEVIDTTLCDRPEIGYKTAREFRAALEAVL